MELCHASNCLWSQTLRELRYWTLSLQELPGIRRYKQTPIQNFHIYSTFWDTLQGTNISPQNGILKMIFLFPRWDMLIPWRVFIMCIPKKKETKFILQQNSCFRTVQRKSFKRNWRRSAFLGFERSRGGILIWLQVSCRIWTTNHTIRYDYPP